MDAWLSVNALSERRFLIVGPSWVGDMVMAQSLFISLTKRLPGCRIDVVAPPWSLPLLERMPEVHSTITAPVQHRKLSLLTRRRIGLALRENGYDDALVLPRSFKSAMIPFLARIPRRTGYRGEMRFGLINDVRRLDKRVLRQTVQRFVALGQDADATQPPSIAEPRLRVDDANTIRLKAEFGLGGRQAVVAMMPGAEFGPAKQWPADYFASLARRLIEDGVEVWLLGSQRDAAICDQITATAPAGVHNLCGKTRLIDAVDLIAHASAAVTNDSGLMHVAAAVGTPLTAIYGSSTPAYTPPLSRSAKALHLDLECSPCFKRRCPLGHTNCLRDIDPADVYAAVTEQLIR
jgi:heptosyltransferase-2